MAFECVSRTHVGLRRKVNEDSLLVRSERGLWAVADGMGGHQAGDVASAKVVEALHDLPIVYGLDALVETATVALEQVNRDLIELAGSDDTEMSIGSTVVGLAIAGDQYRAFWAGDSRAYLLRDGLVTQITRDHSLVQSLVDAGMLSPGEALDHPNANIITRAVGVSPKLQVDTVGGEVVAGDLFILGSDGVTRLVDDQELAEQLASGSMDEAADRLIEMVLARGAPDNATLIIVKAV
ncbi:protein phosphatase 2C domain-containing protein [Sphingomonas sp.]|uniref:PP2C family protein-serine/threonine phosphatase n=1 Tax=Sphingomonas sp. TaxID=28214 RepID=UPI0025F80D18|nr:protein phosphatase 2C domain-containing protein [Sphingomonas sp.]